MKNNSKIMKHIIATLMLFIVSTSFAQEGEIGFGNDVVDNTTIPTPIDNNIGEAIVLGLLIAFYGISKKSDKITIS